MNLTLFLSLAAACMLCAGAVFALGRIIVPLRGTQAAYTAAALCTGIISIALAAATLGTQNDIFSIRLAIDAVQCIVSVSLLVILAKMIRLRTSLHGIGTGRRYYLVAAVMLVAGLLTGLTLEEGAVPLIEESLEGLDDLAASSEGAPDWQMAVILFGNNTRMAITVSTIFAAIPVLGGFYALFSMGLNGALIGFVISLIDKPPTYFAAGLLPHGIFEIPAIVIAAGTGLQVNAILLRGLLTAFQDKETPTLEVMKASLSDARQALSSLLVVLSLLVIAAVIEATLTPRLLALAG